MPLSALALVILGAFVSRENKSGPFSALATVFQRALIEYAGNVSDFAEVDHPESNPSEG
jgi:hypothetical protein